MRIGLGLILTGRCNLACAYCYQRSMAGHGCLSWNGVQAAAMAAFALAPEGVDVVFSGGEPLLERDLLVRCVAELDHVVPAEVEFSMRLITNGSLLDRSLTDLLAEWAVGLQLSLHGSPKQPYRTQAYELLGDLIEAYPDYTRNHLSTATLLPSWRVPGLGRHVRTLLDLGVQDIHLAVPFTPDPCWTAEADAVMEREFETILEASTEHWREGGAIPVACLRPPDQDHKARNNRRDRTVCRAGSGTMFTVDPTGHAWACPCFAPTLQALPPLADAASRALDLGVADSPELPDRLAALPTAVGRERAFTHRISKSAGSRKCAECEDLAECSICPAAICHCGHDPDRVPNHQCAFERITLAARRRLAEMTGATESALDSRRRARLLEELKRALAADRGHG